MTQMRILQVCHEGRGGLQAYTEALSKSLSENGADVTVLTSGSWPDGQNGYTVVRRLKSADKMNLPKGLWAFDRLSQALHNSLYRNHYAVKQRHDVVHLQLGSAIVDQFLLKWLHVKKIPIVLTVHDVQPHVKKISNNLVAMKRYFHIPNKLIVHHRNGKQQLIDYWKVAAEKVAVIPHGIMPANTSILQSRAREHLGLPRPARILLFFGSIRPNKGLDVLIRACGKLFRQETDVILVIAGNVQRTSSYECYQSLVEECGIGDKVISHIRFIKEEDVDFYFAASDILVMPYTRFESQSGVLLRAYAHKKPVVVTSVGGLGELVDEDLTGIVCRPSDVEELRMAIAKILHDTHFFASRYDKCLEVKYSWARLARKTSELYASLMKANVNDFSE